jgi:hypothetical protein
MEFLACAARAAIDRFRRDKSDPSVIVFSEIKRCQLPQFTQFFQKAIFQASALDAFGFRSSCLVPHRRRASRRSACMLKKIRGFRLPNRPKHCNDGRLELIDRRRLSITNDGFVCFF